MLVNCVAYQKGHKLADIEVQEIHDYLHSPGCFVWVALKDPQPDELRAMQEQFGLHDLAVEDAQKGHQRPKLDEYGDSIFVVLHLIEPDPKEDCGLQVGEVAIFVGRNYVLSVRRGSERRLTDVRARAEHEPELLRQGAAYVLYALMDAVVDRYFPLLDSVESELDEVERRIFSAQNAGRANIEALYKLKQKLIVLKHAVGPLVEATSKLFGGRVPQVCANLQDYFRDVYDHLLRLNQSIDSQRETVATALSVNLALINLQENEVVKRLAAYAGLVAVPTLIAGIYGMNFHNMPELDWRYGYPATLGVMGAIDGYLFYLLRRARWL
jgi:magnesium transporter